MKEYRACCWNNHTKYFIGFYRQLWTTNKESSTAIGIRGDSNQKEEGTVDDVLELMT